ncbi:MAG: acyltransferase [Clostridia bacterium]|nr:acyltransferase [Clostridia bacterium]
MNSGKSKARNYTIDYIKFTCAAFVMIWHSIAQIKGDYGCTFHSWFEAIISPIYFCVFIFILISGYLNHKQDLKKYYKNKFTKIILPFLFFSSLKIVYTLIISNAYAHADSYREMLIDAFIFGNLYWFSYCIFVIFCIAPLLWIWFEKNRAFSIAAFLLLFGLNIVIELAGWNPKALSVFQFLTAIQYLPYFVLGIILKLYKKEIDSIRNKCPKLLLLAGSVAVYILGYYLKERLGLPLRYPLTFVQVVATFAFLIVVFGYFRPNQYIVKLSSYSYQFMLIDSFTRVVILAVIDKLFSVSVYWMFPQVLFSVIACYLICEISSRFKITRFLLGI